MKYKIGDKVVPISKSTYGNLASSTTWKNAQESDQPFLYVNEIEDGVLTCGYKSNFGGDFFLERDLISFSYNIEKLKGGDMVYVSDESENMALKQKIKRIFLYPNKAMISPYICVVESDNDEYHEGKPISTSRWKYAVPIPPKPTSIHMKLNDNYDGEVFKDRVHVGCQDFSREKIEEILENMKILSEKIFS